MTPLVGARLEGVALAAPLVGGRRRAMALLLCLGMAAALARGCLHCNGNFSEKFSFYRHHVNLKSWWVGDIPVSGALLTEWSQDTMKELHLAIPAEITREKLDQVAEAVYQRLDQLYQGKMYFPGYFPNELRTIFRDQVHLIQNAIIESRIDCQRHCGIFQYQTISCANCTDSHVVCFGYNCESSAQWESAVKGLLSYLNNWHNQNTSVSPAHVVFLLIASPGTCRTTPAFLTSPSFTCLEPQHLANLTLENVSECLTQH
ncbi:izumo sperm-egg fusion protein 4 isoform X3 [Perognathus longimembris pacificus]|uniref:izumo sperm-egg fusion protein 4 isoform X3 n=1 Tax=Perognathus longimembris pacificus TaxID=214514 RepID=UPI0020186D48|nr:izumo sperm-egg fusion protein 4 isoform X3 [Perognathus longimembris pacificus]